MTTLIISDEEINDIMKIVKFLAESGLLIKALMKPFKMKQKNKKVDFSGVSLLGNLLTSKGVKRPNSSNIPGRGVIRAGEGTIRAGQNFQCCLII